MFNISDVIGALVPNLIAGGVQIIVKVVALVVWIPLKVMFQALPKLTSQSPKTIATFKIMTHQPLNLLHTTLFKASFSVVPI
jgi:hypothetical protein